MAVDLYHGYCIPIHHPYMLQESVTAPTTTQDFKSYVINILSNAASKSKDSTQKGVLDTSA
jgi:hypothetical protein